ncbi:Peptidoglycan-N-acetylglucosamine deacetylase [compost metagenome]
MMLKKLGLLGGALIGILMLLQQSQSIQSFVLGVQDGTAKIALANPYSWNEALRPALSLEGVSSSRNELLELIQDEAIKRKVAPIDAKLDSIWKAIPAYNGVEVDIDKTYRIAKQLWPAQPINYVMKEVPAAIQLEDLGAHPIFKGNPKKPMVSLMINVAWGNEYIPSMLATLEKERVHATFFFDGSWLSKNVELAKQIGAQGHELSNHAYSHKNMSQVSRQKAIEEISRTQDLLTKELGVQNTLFAPPSGDFDQETVQIAAELKLKTVLWTLDTVDWTNPGAGRIIDRISSRVEPGSLILMHPTVSSSQALQAMIQSIKRKGYVLGTVSELLSPKRIQLPDVQS